MKKMLMFAGVAVMGLTLMSYRIAQPFDKIASAFLWESTTHDFGLIEASVPVEHVFRFTNNGNEPLIIANVKASCGCTVAKYTKEPIAPGEKGEVLAQYDAKKSGKFIKTVTVHANTGDEAVILKLKGEVISAE